MLLFMGAARLLGLLRNDEQRVEPLTSRLTLVELTRAADIAAVHSA